MTPVEIWRSATHLLCTLELLHGLIEFALALQREGIMSERHGVFVGLPGFLGDTQRKVSLKSFCGTDLISLARSGSGFLVASR